MKILLTVVVSADVARSNSDTLYEGIELIYPEEGESGKEYLSRAVKAAKGKFTVIADRKFLFADVQSLLNIIDKNTADVVSFLGNIAVRTAVLKGIKEFTDDFSLTLLGILGSKTVLKTVYNPFNFEHKAHAFTEENTTALCGSVRQSKGKACKRNLLACVRNALRQAGHILFICFAFDKGR